MSGCPQDRQAVVPRVQYTLAGAVSGGAAGCKLRSISSNGDHCEYSTFSFINATLQEMQQAGAELCQAGAHLYHLKAYLYSLVLSRDTFQFCTPIMIKDHCKVFI